MLESWGDKSTVLKKSKMEIQLRRTRKKTTQKDFPKIQCHQIYFKTRRSFLNQCQHFLSTRNPYLKWPRFLQCSLAFILKFDLTLFWWLRYWTQGLIWGFVSSVSVPLQCSTPGTSKDVILGSRRTFANSLFIVEPKLSVSRKKPLWVSMSHSTVDRPGQSDKAADPLSQLVRPGTRQGAT